jgi:hypothetical protein
MLGNEPVIVVNSAKAAHETFLAQGNAMSSRPMFYTFHKVIIPKVVIENRLSLQQRGLRLVLRLLRNR